MAESHRALAEARRVVRLGGRVAFPLWGAMERLAAFTVAFGALAAAAVDLANDAPPPPVAFGQSPDARIEAL